MWLRQPARQALRFLPLIAAEPDRRRTRAELAGAAGTSAAALAEALNGLVRAGILTLRRGPKGGYAAARPPATVTVREVVERLHGPLFDDVCPVHETPCYGRAGCPVHDLWTQAQEELLRTLGRMTLADLVGRLQDAALVDRLLARSGAGPALGDPSRSGGPLEGRHES